MNRDDLVYTLALRYLEGVGEATIKKMLQYFPAPKDIFSAPEKDILRVERIGEIVFSRLFNSKETALEKAKKELEELAQKDVRILFYGDEDFPQILNHYETTPYLLYYRGNIDLNAPRKISIIGTRKMTEYGRDFIAELVNILTSYNCLILSGLAYGVDIESHKRALDHNIPTVAILGSGLGNIYPQKHVFVAEKMIQNGGILTEFPYNTKPEAFNFPRRNRTLAALSEAVLVVETQKKGGSVITAGYANEYNKDVMALVGDRQRKTSDGCNELVKRNLASAVSHPEDVPKFLGWEKQGQKTPEVKQNMKLSSTEKRIINGFNGKEKIHFDQLVQKLNITANELTMILFELEMKNLILQEPGNFYIRTT